MIIVTGGAGFIGSNIIHALNQKGIKDILVVDHLKDGTKFKNLVDLDIADYLDREEFLSLIVSGEPLGQIDGIFHQGACSATTEWDGKYMMENNFQYSKDLLHWSLENEVPFIYASSAATYGGRSDNFIEERRFESPLNVYGYSKFLFDEYVRNILPEANSPVCGLRYFNVYGPRESHKGSMASVAFHLNNQMNKGENPKLFAGSEGFLRDFIYVEDVAKLNLWCLENEVSGIFNAGTGKAESFEAIANAVIDYHQRGHIESIAFPEHLKGHYQSYTQADLTKLKAAGFQGSFLSVAEGVKRYLTWLNE